MSEVAGGPRVRDTMGWRVARAWKWTSGYLAAGAIECIARIDMLGRLPRRAVIPLERVVITARGRDLFDPAFYLERNSDVAAAECDALSHYLRYGWREGRAPNARFDDAHYRAEAGMVRGQPISALAHYLAVGARLGACPMPNVDLGAYVSAEPGLRVARIDPYDHMLTTAKAPVVAKPDLAAAVFQLGRAMAPPGPAEVDVIIPVYRGRAETLNTLAHVLDALSETRFRVVVVDDATPHAKLAEDLDRLAERGLITLLRNKSNRGFVASVNRGMAEARGRDVIWLNADTEVYDGWIDRLRRAAYGAPDIATVTPLTNNGTICSYPKPNTDNPGTLERSWAEVDGLAAVENQGVVIESPTGVGFCMYVRHDAIRQVGRLDEDAFGRGYGEENDFSQRAIAIGMRNVIAADVVVRHFGATSFRGQRASRIESALQVLDRRYPRYRAEVGAFVEEDRLAAARRTLDLARLRLMVGRRNILIVTHGRGGGTHQHVQDEIVRLRAAGASVFVVTARAARRHVSVTHAEIDALPSLASLPFDGAELWAIIRALGIHEVAIHHLIDLGPDAAQILRRELQALNVPYTFTVHDYLSVCPRITMTDRLGRYCGEPGLAGCRRCLSHRLSQAGRQDIVSWRGHYRALLAGSRRIIAPDKDVSDRMSGYFPDLSQIEVRPHEPAPLLASRKHLPQRRPGPLRIAVVGAIGPEKGFDVLLGLARHLTSERLPASLTVIGSTKDDTAARALGIEITGPYLNADVQTRIDEVDPDLIWIPSIWPETYSYTLSIALASGRPLAAFAIGALATRLRGVRRGRLIPLDLAHQPKPLWSSLSDAARVPGLPSGAWADDAVEDLV